GQAGPVGADRPGARAVPPAAGADSGARRPSPGGGGRRRPAHRPAGAADERASARRDPALPDPGGGAEHGPRDGGRAVQGPPDRGGRIAMAGPNLADLPGHELGRLLRNREATAAEIAEAALQRIEDLDDRLHAFLTVTADLARDQAAQVDRRLLAGETLPAAAGIPLALKDVLTTKGIRSTAGSKILEPYVPPYDCTPWERLAASSAVLVGKTNCD